MVKPLNSFHSRVRRALSSLRRYAKLPRICVDRSRKPEDSETPTSADSGLTEPVSCFLKTEKDRSRAVGGRALDDSSSVYYFKLFNNLKSESEVELAEHELRTLFGAVTRVRNFADELVGGELSEVFQIKEEPSKARLQDAIIYELPYGRVQGFKGVGSLQLLPKLVRRLAYTREIYVIVAGRSPRVAGRGLAKRVNFFKYPTAKGSVLRAITIQFFLEKSEYISKLSRTEAEVDSNLDRLLGFTRLQYRIPATETMSIGKRLEDWFAIREEPSLYLTHYMHPYKGKFHPKLARSLLNIVCPQDDALVLDNFSGSGTTLVEAQWLGIESVGVDINPLSALMSDVKVQAISISPRALKSAIRDFLKAVESEELIIQAKKSGQEVLSDSPERSHDYQEEIAQLPERVRDGIPEVEIRKVLRAARTLRTLFGDSNGNPLRDFLQLGLSGAISDISRRTKRDFMTVLKERFDKLRLRVYLADKLPQKLAITLATGVCYIGDSRDLVRLKSLGGKSKSVPSDSIDGIVNSPPYSTALDYVKNDLPQLSMLGMVGDLDLLQQNLIGSPGNKGPLKDLEECILHKRGSYLDAPRQGKLALTRMARRGASREAARTLKFWLDMKATLIEMRRVLKPLGLAAIVIGDNRVQLDGSDDFEKIPNVAIIEELGKSVGFERAQIIERKLEKTMSGLIRDEAVLILRKQE